jgi:hypothetical protein
MAVSGAGARSSAVDAASYFLACSSRSRPAAFLAAFRTMSTMTSAASTAATEREEVPPEDYYDGHLVANQLEYLNDLIEHTDLLGRHLEDLKDKHRNLLLASSMSNHPGITSTIKWMEVTEVDALFEPARRAHSTMRQHLQDTRSELQRRVYAVDAPDGESDGRVQEEMMEIRNIVDDAARFENAQEILRDRESSARVFAVDAPDGQPDGCVHEELAEIKHMIDDASALEDVKAIQYQHAAQEQIRKDRARDPEHDW